MGYVYLIGSIGNPLVKIGNSSDPVKRMRQLQTGSPLLLVILWQYPTYDAETLELALHDHFADKRKHNEWFDLGSSPVSVVMNAMSRYDFLAKPESLPIPTEVAEILASLPKRNDLAAIQARVAKLERKYRNR